ncbi:rab11 family-interacting protein 5 [Podarcis raffonei]|uniref:rab11 family-interacting protein 5 n=1 Tax=Podarcis raffonei TaxID=65483 RepID=UPI0023299531|nr:rab11 family-interacting protein 5 [Podarcis raffonei]
MSRVSSAADGAPSSPPSWLPSHVQVTVVQARALRAKGGPSGDAFVALQLGGQKYRTPVAPQRSGPRWADECALQLPPTPGPDDADDDPALLLQITVWQRALVGTDRFLGRAAVPLRQLLQRGGSHPDQWYKLHSKPGKKEKERGEIQLSIQFTRHSLTASMFDLSIKDKPRSPFGKLKDKLKGRQKYDMESASAIVPSSSGALDEEFGLAGKKAKAKGSFFFKNKLRKSSLTQSNTSLGSDSTLSSAGSLVGIGPSEAGMVPSPSRHSSFSTDRSVRDFLPSPKLTHKRAFSDEASQSTQSLKPQNDPISRSSLCINGSHIYCEEPTPKPSFLSAAPAPPAAAVAASKPHEEAFGSEPPAAPEPDLPPWSSSILPKAPPKDPPRFIPSPPILAAQEEDKLSVKTIALNKHRVRARREEEEAAAAAAALHAESKPIQIATPMVFSGDVRRVRPQPEEEAEEEKRFSKTGFFRRGSSKEGGGKSGEPSPRVVVAAGEERGRSRNSSWFSLQDAKEMPPKPSSPDHPCLSADQDPPPFATAGDLLPEAQSASTPEAPPPSPPASARAPPEWDDSFDAFATSRLRPDAPREPPPAGKGLEGGSHPDAPLAETPEPQAGGQEDAGPGSPDPLSCTPEQALGGVRRESLGGQALGQPSESSSWGEPCEEGPASGSDATAEQAPEDSGSPWPTADEVFLEESPPPLPQSATAESPLRGSGRAPEAETGEASTADSPRWDAVGREEAVLCLAPDEAPDASLNIEEAREMPGWGAQEQAEGPPRKPPRRFVPLGLEEAWGVQERRKDEAAAPEELEVPAEGAPSMGEGKPPPVAAAATSSLAPLVIMGAAGVRATGSLGLAGVGAEPAADNELRGRVLPSGETPGAEQFETCPTDLSLGASGLSDSSVWQAGAPWPQGLSELGSLQTAKEIPARKETPQDSRPSPSVLFWTAVEEEQPPSQDSWPEGRRPGLGGPEEDLPPGERGALSFPEGDPAPSPLSQSLPATSPPFPAVLAGGQLRQARAGSSLSESELSSSWSDDRVVDFKKADFWQAGREEPQGSWTDTALAPGNPFAPWAGTPPPPSPQNNPFVERPADPASSEAALLPVSWVEGLGGPEAAPRGFFLAHPSEDQPAAPVTFSTPSLEGAAHPSDFLFPSPVLHPDLGRGSAVAAPSLALPRPRAASVASSVSPVGATQAEEAPPLQWTASPHPVKPISSSPGPKAPQEEKEKQRPAGSLTPVRSGGQEREPGSAVSVTAGGAPTSQLEKAEPKRDSSALDPSAKYYHLTHDELIQLLLKREAELSQTQDQVRELENYIDLLLVRIMEQSPRLLQIPLEGEPKAAK